MNGSAVQFPFVVRDPAVGALRLMPVLPITMRRSHTVVTSGIPDTGATMNVLPYSVGQQLGLDWDQLTVSVTLAGALAACPAKGALVTCVVGSFAPVTLAFAWAQADNVPLLLGQVNVFQEFDVCFYRSRGVFEVQPKQP